MEYFVRYLLKNLLVDFENGTGGNIVETFSGKSRTETIRQQS